MNIRHFSIPEMPLSKNVWQRLHWAKRGRIKAEWERWVWGLVNEHPRMPRPIASVRCDVVVGWDKPGPLPDPQNLAGMAHEVIADGLVKAGIIADDSMDARGVPQYEQGTTQVNRGNGATEIVLRWD